MSRAVPSGRVNLIALLARGVKEAADPDKKAAGLGTGGVNDEVVGIKGLDGVEGMEDALDGEG